VSAAAWWGARYGFLNVPEQHYNDLEYRDRLEILAFQLYQQAIVEKKNTHIEQDCGW